VHGHSLQGGHSESVRRQNDVKVCMVTVEADEYVAEKTSSLRNDNLGFSHHREVAKLTPEKQELLKR
jgi:hypothetical protein